MAFAINNRNSMTQNTLADCAPVACPACGGLECLCRPRFFAGQLLTDEDLQRLDRYIVEKNKLHNRYLVGWGVACGLEVVCNTCDTGVTVRPGYALSPCGEDIVVCAATAVDVCSMIQNCKKKQPRDCQPAQPGGADPCSDTTEQWVLSICYDEKPSRGIVPLKNTGNPACCSRCACGGSCGCGCGGQASGNGNGKNNGCSCGTSTQTLSTSAQTQCEPTLVCEGYRFAVCKLTGTQSKTNQLGAMVQRFLCCLLNLGELFAKFPSSNNQQDVQNWCCAIRDNLLDFTAANPGYDCGLAQRIANLCQSNDPQQIGNDVGAVLLEYLQYCFCSALLPPCPAVGMDDCVPLATITISKSGGGCSITRVCNIDARKFLVDLPNLGYWLSWIPFGAGLRRIFSALCCNAFKWERVGFQPVDRAIGVQSARMTAKADSISAPQPAADFIDLLLETTRSGDRKVDLQSLTMAALGMSDEKGTHNLTDLELQYPFESLMLNQVGRTLVQSYVGGLGSIARGTVSAAEEAAAGTAPGTAPGTAAGTAAVAPAAPSPAKAAEVATKTDLQALQAQLDAMKEELKSSQAKTATSKKPTKKA